VRLAVDAKYKLYDDRNKLEPADVYQGFLYAYAYGQVESESARPPIAVIVYPSSQPTVLSTHLRVRNTRGTAGAELLGLGVWVPDALAEARQRIRGPATQALWEAIQRAIGIFDGRASRPSRPTLEEASAHSL
jgi:hypothetical protein